MLFFQYSSVRQRLPVCENLWVWSSQIMMWKTLDSAHLCVLQQHTDSPEARVHPQAKQPPSANRVNHVRYCTLTEPASHSERVWPTQLYLE